MSKFYASGPALLFIQLFQWLRVARKNWRESTAARVPVF